MRNFAWKNKELCFLFISLIHFSVYAAVGKPGFRGVSTFLVSFFMAPFNAKIVTHETPSRIRPLSSASFSNRLILR